MDREAWHATVNGVERVGHDWATERQTYFINFYILNLLVYFLLICFMYYIIVWRHCNLLISASINWYSGCLQFLTVKERSLWICPVVCLVSQSSDSLWPHGFEPTIPVFPQNFPGKNTGVSCHFLLQGIFQTPASNLASPVLEGKFYTIWTTKETYRNI